jgi:hypothetical protein
MISTGVYGIFSRKKTEWVNMLIGTSSRLFYINQLEPAFSTSYVREWETRNRITLPKIFRQYITEVSSEVFVSTCPYIMTLTQSDMIRVGVDYYLVTRGPYAGVICDTTGAKKYNSFTSYLFQGMRHEL